jgi:hypothetical protein
MAGESGNSLKEGTVAVASADAGAVGLVMANYTGLRHSKNERQSQALSTTPSENPSAPPMR